MNPWSTNSPRGQTADKGGASEVGGWIRNVTEFRDGVARHDLVTVHGLAGSGNSEGAGWPLK